MPYPNEHSARLKDPDTLRNREGFLRVRRTSGSGDGTVQGVIIPDSIDVIWYVFEDGSVIAQALRFPVSNWTEDEARDWLRDNGINYIKFEPASGEKSFKYQDKEFETKKALFDFLIKNRDKLIAQKKAIKKEADCPVAIKPVIINDSKIAARKEAGEIIIASDLQSLDVEVVINTTNYLDMHGDVHIPGLWNRSLQNNKMIMHVQEHKMEFSKIIADGDQLKAYTKTFDWSELGYDYQGTTEALIFESKILRKRNEYMMLQYANEWVRNHSVGMYYVKMDIAVNDEDYPSYFDAWNKYYPDIANKEEADEKGFFWYILEAKLVEGSSVPIGSNIATPTISTGKNDPPAEGTQHKSDPDTSTQVDYKYLLTNLKN